jgi:uncharacterized membrane protein YedE/YeeE
MAEHTVATPIGAQRVGIGLPRWASLGILFGVLSTAAIALYGPIGVSGTYPRFVGATLRRVAPDYATSNPYLVKMGTLLTPETMLVVGLLIGGIVASLFARARREPAAPAAEMVHAAETTTGRRYRDAFIGGVLIVFGARLAGGCTSGHIISGMTQLAVSGVLFAAAVFASGLLTARLIKGGR